MSAEGVMGPFSNLVSVNDPKSWQKKGGKDERGVHILHPERKRGGDGKAQRTCQVTRPSCAGLGGEKGE